MTTAATSLLGLALPVQGELSGTWGDTVNNSITNLLDAAVAGTTTLSADADVTLTTTTLAANQAREAIILWTAGGTATRYITAPAQSKAYVVINKTSSTQSIVIRGVGPTTGVTIPAGTSRVVAWNGVDFVATAVDAASISGLGAGVATFLATPSSANLAAAVTDETGTGALVFGTSPTIATPAITGATTISVTDNTNAALRITQLGTGNALLVEDSTNPDSTPFVIDASGNIASGLTSTTLAMEIYRTSTANFRIDGDGVNSTIQARSFSDSADTGPILNYARGRGTKAVTTIVQSGDLLAQYRGGGWDGVQIIQAANIEVRVDGAPGTNDMPGRLVFSTTADGANSPTERMRIDNAGNVGIGTTAPASRLHVRQDQDGTTRTIIQNRNGTGTPISELTFITGSFNLSDSRYAYIQSLGGSSNSLVFGTGIGAAPVDRMTINASGNVGIGTTAPNASALLDVQSTTKGVRMPNMTTTQKNAIASPAAGLMVFDTTLAKLCVYTGAAWQTITST